MEGSSPQCVDALPLMVVACLCADWCGTCRDYKKVFDSVRSECATEARFVWVDIEDQAALVDEMDIDNFPTVLIGLGQGQGTEVCFFGPVLPHRSTLLQLIAHAAANQWRVQVDGAVLALAKKLV